MHVHVIAWAGGFVFRTNCILLNPQESEFVSSYPLEDCSCYSKKCTVIAGSTQYALWLAITVRIPE